MAKEQSASNRGKAEEQSSEYIKPTKPKLRVDGVDWLQSRLDAEFQSFSP